MKNSTPPNFLNAVVTDNHNNVYRVWLAPHDPGIICISDKLAVDMWYHPFHSRATHSWKIETAAKAGDKLFTNEWKGQFVTGLAAALAEINS